MLAVMMMKMKKKEKNFCVPALQNVEVIAVATECLKRFHAEPLGFFFSYFMNFLGCFLEEI
jgi:hypothetical protein